MPKDFRPNNIVWQIIDDKVVERQVYDVGEHTLCLRCHDGVCITAWKADVYRTELAANLILAGQLEAKLSAVRSRIIELM